MIEPVVWWVYALSLMTAMGAVSLLYSPSSCCYHDNHCNRYCWLLNRRKGLESAPKQLKQCTYTQQKSHIPPTESHSHTSTTATDYKWRNSGFPHNSATATWSTGKRMRALPPAPTPSSIHPLSSTQQDLAVHHGSSNLEPTNMSTIDHRPMSKKRCISI
jgi:hypothetical protein